MNDRTTSPRASAATLAFWEAIAPLLLTRAGAATRLLAAVIGLGWLVKREVLAFTASTGKAATTWAITHLGLQVTGVVVALAVGSISTLLVLRARFASKLAALLQRRTSLHS